MQHSQAFMFLGMLIILPDVSFALLSMQVGKGKYNGVIDCAKQIYATQVSAFEINVPLHFMLTDLMSAFVHRYSARCTLQE